MRIGIFGGAFDPPHAGHRWVVESALSDPRLALDEVWVVPTWEPPHKPAARSAFVERLRAVRELLRGLRARVLDIEARLGTPSYTVRTLEVLAAESPEHEFTLVMGSDQADLFDSWHEPARIRELAGLAVVPRSGLAPGRVPSGALVLRDGGPEISSTEIRTGARP